MLAIPGSPANRSHEGEGEGEGEAEAEGEGVGVGEGPPPLELPLPDASRFAWRTSASACWISLWNVARSPFFSARSAARKCFSASASSCWTCCDSFPPPVGPGDGDGPGLGAGGADLPGDCAIARYLEPGLPSHGIQPAGPGALPGSLPGARERIA